MNNKIAIAIRKVPLVIVVIVMWLTYMICQGANAVSIKKSIPKYCSATIDAVVVLEPSLQNVDKSGLTIEHGKLMYGSEELILSDNVQTIVDDYYNCHGQGAVYDHWTLVIFVFVFGLTWFMLFVEFAYRDTSDAEEEMTIVVRVESQSQH